MQVQMPKFAKKITRILPVYMKKRWRPGLCSGSHSNCCLSLYLIIVGIGQAPKNASGVLESSGKFCNQGRGNPGEPSLFCVRRG